MTVLSLQNISKAVGNSTPVPAFDLTVARGECTAIQCHAEVGQMLIRLILGLLPLSSGTVLLNGTVLDMNDKQILKNIGVCFQNDGLYERLTSKQYIKFWSDLYDVSPSIPALLQKVGLADKTDVRISMLTLSEQRRLLLARCIVQDPTLIIMEDPEQNLNIESCLIFRSVVAKLIEEGKAVLITTSSLEQAISLTNNVYRLTESGLKQIETADEEPAERNSAKARQAAQHTLPDNPEHAGGEQALSQEEVVSAVQSEPSEDQPASADHSAATVAQPNHPDGLAGEAEDPAEPNSKQTIQSPLETLRPMKMEKIPAKINDKIILFDPLEINFIESNEGVSQLHVRKEVFPCTLTLNELDEKLKAFGFFRCHRSYIVNLQRVREVITWTRNSFSLVLDDELKSSIPLSKGKFDELKYILGI